MRDAGVTLTTGTVEAFVVEDRTVLSNLIASQTDLHARFGGVVPELASRAHVEALNPLMEEALESKTQKVVFIKADEDAPYGSVMEAMDEVRAAGVEDMGLITERKKAN